MGEGGSVAVATASGSDGSSQLREREQERRGRERGEPESEGEVRGGVGRLWARIRSREGSRRWPGTHVRVPRFPSAYWQEEEDGSALGGLGRYSARTSRPAQVTLSLFSNLNCFCFLFIRFCFDLVKY